MSERLPTTRAGQDFIRLPRNRGLVTTLRAVVAIEDEARAGAAPPQTDAEPLSVRDVYMFEAGVEEGKRLAGFDARLSGWAAWIVSAPTASVKDHACVECVPDGPMVVPGFQCVPHEARAALSLPASESSTPPRECPTCHRVIEHEAHGGAHPSPGDHDPAYHVAANYGTAIREGA